MVETILYQEWKKLSMTGFWNFLSMYFRRDFDTLTGIPVKGNSGGNFRTKREFRSGTGCFP